MGAGKLNARLAQRRERLRADGGVSPDPAAAQVVEMTPLPPRPDGPFDLLDVVELSGYVDLGALLLPARRDVNLRVNVAPDGSASDLAVVHDGWRLDLTVFAGPRTHGTWEQVAEQIAAALRADGTDVDLAPGPFGTHLATTTPGPDGTKVPVRVWGVDGPGWLLRATLRPVPAPVAPPAADDLPTVTEQEDPSADPQEGPAAPDGHPSEPGPAAEQDPAALAGSWESTVGPGPANDADGLPGGILGEMWRKAIIRRGPRPLPVGATVPLAVDPELLSGDWSAPVAEPVQQSKFAHLPGLRL